MQVLNVNKTLSIPVLVARAATRGTSGNANVAKSSGRGPNGRASPNAATCAAASHQQAAVPVVSALESASGAAGALAEHAGVRLLAERLEGRLRPVAWASMQAG